MLWAFVLFKWIDLIKKFTISINDVNNFIPGINHVAIT